MSVLALTLLAPERLWLLALLPFAVLVGVVVARRSRPDAVRHPDVALVAAVAPARVPWRRHAAGLGLLVAVVALVTTLARPAEAREVQREDAVVVLAIDTSLSMTATDIEPDRLTAAIEAATDFVDAAPDTHRIGVVTFSGTARTVVAPTDDHDAVVAALADIEPAEGTAPGDGLDLALALAAQADDSVVTGDESAYAAVVLLSDGREATVTDPAATTLAAATDQAVEAGVPVYTVAYGTDAGTVVIDGEERPVPADPEAMAAVAAATGGETHTATSAAQLVEVYDRIGTRIATVTETVDVLTPFALIAALGLAAAVAAGLVWSPRLT